MRPSDVRPELAEAVGTFLLVFAGCGAIMTSTPATPTAPAATFGLVVTILVYALGHVSGAHFNPAITIAFASTRHFPWRRVPGYVAAQVAGAVAAALLLRALLGNVASVGATVPTVAPATAVVVEAVATFVLALVIVAVATDPRVARGAAGLAIGGAAAVGAVAFGPLTDASMNPGRSIGPALASGEIAPLWIYLAGPILGAVAGMAAYEWLRPGARPAREGEALGALGRVPAVEEATR